MSAMTRAEDELYVTGHLTKRGKLEGSWYEAIELRCGRPPRWSPTPRALRPR